jgi:hypothetical protein
VLVGEAFIESDSKFNRSGTRLLLVALGRVPEMTCMETITSVNAVRYDAIFVTKGASVGRTCRSTDRRRVRRRIMKDSAVQQSRAKKVRQNTPPFAGIGI